MAKKRQQALVEKSSTLFLRLAVLALAAIVLALCVIALPAGIRSTEWGGYRPILIGMYIPAVPFFVALYQALKLLGLIDRSKAFTNASVRALGQIKYCAVLISVLYALGMPYIYYAADKDDAPGVVALGLIIVFASFAIGVAAALFQRLFQNAVDIKSENDLTV